MDDRKRINKSKSSAKAAGVKSVIAEGDNIYMTSFGNGNSANLEARIYNNTSVELNEIPAFKVNNVTDSKIEIAGKRFMQTNATADKPSYSLSTKTAVHQDMLCLKNELEMRFFGKTFNDNIHIQVIHNILDIEKIIAQYATNAVYALNNLCRSENGYVDIIGDISTTMPIEKYIEKNAKREDKDKAETIKLLNAFPYNKRLGYFSNAFYHRVWDSENNCYEKKRGNFETELLYDEDIYRVLEMIGSLRQWAFHGVEKVKNGQIVNDKAWLYKLDSNLNENYKNLLDFIYSEAVARINDNFEKDNSVNILILADIFSKENYSDIVKEYYGFIVTKKHKNMGFSIKTLREFMLNDTEFSSDPDKKNKKYDSVRSKLYKIIDFVIYHGYLNEDKEQADRIVEQLRSCTKEEEKTDIYVKEANRLWRKYKNTVSNTISEKVKGENIKELQNKTRNINIDNTIIDNYSSYFTELIYILTAFIDGKEINDLLTTLVHKFDNISSQLEVMKNINLETSFVDDYKFFENSKQICEEMVILNSFARMCPIDVSAKKIMYQDALDILGIESNMNEEELSAYLDKMLCLDENGKPIMDKNKKKSGMRNFIASNVVDSSRFKYLVRYGNSKKIHSLAKCEPAVYFVLSGIPDSQIERYYDSCRKPEDKPVKDLKAKRKYLAKMIGEMSFEKFKVNEAVQRSKEKNWYYSEEDKNNWETKVRYQAVIRIYLTVMYLMLKNLVNVNSRYVIGFHCLERDAGLYGIKYNSKKLMHLNEYIMNIEESDKNAAGEIKEPYPVERCVDAKNRHLRSKKWYKITCRNMRNSSNDLAKEFRNTVAHVNALRNIDENINGIEYANSYFEMYHYIIQRELERKYNNDRIPNKNRISNKNTISKYIKALNEYRSYNKDFVKAYCVPMAYNIVRFKNLTIDGLFDKNDFRGDEKEEKTSV